MINQIIVDLKYIRESNRMTQFDLSKISGVPEKTISRIESGKCSPKLDTVIKLLKPLGYGLKICLKGDIDEI